MFHTKDNSKTIYLQEGKKTAKVNGQEIKLDAAVVNKNGLTYIPLRFISETLGAYVNYNSKENRVVVRTPTGQAAVETLMRGDLTEARRIAIGSARVNSHAPQTEPGEMYHYSVLTFPEGEALRFILNDSGFAERYYEVNEEGLPVLK